MKVMDGAETLRKIQRIHVESCVTVHLETGQSELVTYCGGQHCWHNREQLIQVMLPTDLLPGFQWAPSPIPIKTESSYVAWVC